MTTPTAPSVTVLAHLTPFTPQVEVVTLRPGVVRLCTKAAVRRDGPCREPVPPSEKVRGGVRGHVTGLA